MKLNLDYFYYTNRKHVLILLLFFNKNYNKINMCF